MAVRFLIACISARMVIAADYYSSPTPAGDELSLEDCLKKLVNNDRCLLKPGHYYVNKGGVTLAKTKLEPRTDITLAAGAGGEVLIDGTAELTGTNGQALEWKTCAEAQEEDEALECPEGVFVANLGDVDFSQLFMGGDDAEKRRLLFPARWPNAKASELFNQSGLPEWAPVTDTYASWSFPNGTISGRMAEKGGTPTLGKKRKPGAFGSFVDNGGDEVEEEVEVEEDMYEIIKRKGPGFLNESGISVEGATIVIVYGKGSVESGRVYKHEKGFNEFEFEQPSCPTGGYGSCGKGFWKDSFVSYFFENSLALLDSPFEYYLEIRKKGGNRLFLKVGNNEKPAVRLWGKQTDFFLTMKGSEKFTVSGIKTFATGFTTDGPNPNLEVYDSTFLYSNAGKRILGDYSTPTRMMFSNANDGKFINNTWMYAEGTAFEAKGNRMAMTDNLFRYNGILSTNGPQTIKWTSTNGTVSHNSLEWNGQVTGWKLMGSGQVITKNRVQHQNWGNTLHDGAGIHVQMSAGASEFSYNWVQDGHSSLGIRFDTSSNATFTKPEDIGHDAQVHHNVLWGDTKLAMKGERMTVTSNTLVEGSKFSLIRAFGNQQQMHKLSVATSNAFEMTPTPRGRIYSGRRRTPACGPEKKCIPSDPDGTMPTGWENKKDTPEDGAEKQEGRPKGPAWELPPGIDMTENLIYKGLCWDGLEDCPHNDFRPKKENVYGHGAYEKSNTSYWIPGRREKGPSSPVPADNAEDVPFGETLGLAFLPSEKCKKHMVSLSWEGKKKPLEGTLDNGANLWLPGKLPKNRQIAWIVTPVKDEPGCEGPAASWSFTTAKSERTTTTTTTTSTSTTTIGTPCQDKKVANAKTEENKKKMQNWCTKQADAGKCNRANVKKNCEKTCGLCCEDVPPADVTQAKNILWCALKKKLDKCDLASAQDRCKKTCNLCGVPEPTKAPTEAPPVACADQPPGEISPEKNLQWCEKKRDQKKCNNKSAKKRCKLTCGLCPENNVDAKMGTAFWSQIFPHEADHQQLKGSGSKGFLHRASSLIQLATSKMLTPWTDIDDEVDDVANPEL